MNSLASLLSFGPGALSRIPPASAHIAVTDTLAASGAFVPVYLARTMLFHATRTFHGIDDADDGPGPAVIWIGCDGSGEVHWRSLLRKAGINAQTQRRLRYIDAVDVALSGRSGGLVDLLRVVQAGMQTRLDASKQSRSSDASALIVVDDLSALAWSLPNEGTSAAHDLTRWVRALRLVAEEHGAALCTLQHASSTSLYSDTNAQDGTDENLLRHLLASVEPDVWIEVRGLRSGRARDCDGEIVLRPLARPQIAHTLSRQSHKVAGREEADEEEEDLSAFAMPNLSIPPRPLLFRTGVDPTARLAAASASSSLAGGGGSTGRAVQSDEWKGVQLWARGTMRGFL